MSHDEDELRRDVLSLLENCRHIRLSGSDEDKGFLAKLLIDYISQRIPHLHVKLRNARMKVARSKGRHTSVQWRALLAKYGGKCARCGSDDDIQKDHVVPIVRGGSDHISNLQPLCGSCNASKGDRVQ